MAMRPSSGHALPYNPLEWTSARGTSPQAGAAAQLGRASPQAYSDGKSLITAQESYIAACNSLHSLWIYVGRRWSVCEWKTTLSTKLEGNGSVYEANMLICFLLCQLLYLPPDNDHLVKNT